MRIAIINRNFSRTGGGAESYAVSIAEQLAARHEVHVYSQETDEPLAGVSYHRVATIGARPRWLNQFVFALSSWWQTRRGFDVVHSHENTWHGQVQTIHVRPLRYNLLHGKRGARRMLQWLKIRTSPRLATYLWLEGARFARKPGRSIVATSEMLRQECEAAYPGSRKRLLVITPGTKLQQDTITRTLARRMLDLPPEAPLLLFVANDYRRKGLDALLAALKLLPPDVQLVVAGKPGAAPRYVALARELGLASRVHFLGPLDDLTPAYRAVDALAHPTLEDTYAMVVLEAMSHGLPVVLSGPAHCGIARELHDGQEALLLHDPRDVAALGRLLREVLDDEAMAAQLRQQGLRFAQSHSWEGVAQQYERLYEAACLPEKRR
ncbi:MAG: glycosyltransferase family 4 protein [Curvibacter sp.]|jgi:glycosyltransferase involved in cell wall biosynthesis